MNSWLFRASLVIMAAAIAVLVMLLGGSPASAQEAVPDQPEGLTGELLDYLVVGLDWDDTEGATSYQVQYWDKTGDSPAWAEVPEAGYDGSSAVVSGLPDQFFYYFQVRAVNDAGASEWSDFVFLPGNVWPDRKTPEPTPEPTPTPTPTPEPTGPAPAPDNSSPEFPSTETGNRTVSEDTAAGQNIGSPVAATDDDNDALTYFLGGTDAGFFDIVDTSGQLQTKAALDYGAKSTYTVTVTAKDPSGLADEITVTINVIDVEEPSVAITLSSSGSVEPGNEMTITMSFSGLEPDSDTATTDYIFRADVVDTDQCEGDGLGVDRYMYKVDEDPEVHTGTISADCPAGDYTIKAIIASAANVVELGSATARFTITEPPTDEGCPAAGYDPTPTAVEVEAVPIVVDATTEKYYVLFVRPDLDSGREIPVSVTLGQDGTTTLTEQLSVLPKEHYRVEEFLVAEPADVDGDCIDDITELADPVGMNPLNPAPSIGSYYGAVAIPDHDTFEALSYEGSVKFYLLGMDTDRPVTLFQNTKTHQLHFTIVDAIQLGYDAVRHGYEPEGEWTGQIDYRPNVVAPDGSLGVYRYSFTYGLDNSKAHSFEAVAYTYEILAASMALLDNNLAYYPMTVGAREVYQEERTLYEDSRVNVLLGGDFSPGVDFISLNRGEGYGFLRVMSREERPNPRDIVIYETLPNELSRVAGIITTVPQTRLSHVNLRAVQDGAPNAFIRDALNDADIDDLLDSYVHYKVTEDGYTLSAATRAEVDAHFSSSRPAKKQTPQRDLSVTEITALSDIEFDDWNAFGVKAANVAALGTFGFPEGTVPDGFAVPFYFYDEFMKHNDFYTRIETMLADPDFQTDFDVQQDELKDLRKKIKKGETPEWMTEALEEMHESFPEGTSLRYRSSTNNEDLPRFSGAGLYDSKTQHPEETEEDGIAKSLKQVYASLWNFRAFTEREFHRVDHLAAAMAVLVHPNYSGELANGVAVSFDPIRNRHGSYYVNTQLGEDLDTNPEAHSVPEELLLYGDGTHSVLAISNQAPRGQLLMSNDQLDQLRRHLAVIHKKFAKLYGIGPDEDFAMEIEFKITSDNVLAIKQARPWVFSPASASDGAGTVTLSAAQPRVDTPLTATLTDPDGGVSGVTWSWHSSQDRITWTVISGAAEASYTPDQADVGRYLRATASYTDGKGPGKSAEGVSTPTLPSPEEPCSQGPCPVEVEAVPMVVDSTGEEYFVLYVRKNPDAGAAVDLPVSVALGREGTTTLAENVAALPKERYRVEKYLVAEPADVDGDGIDDITELGDRIGMNPVNPAHRVSFSDGALAIPDRETFEALSYQGKPPVRDDHLVDLEYVKFYVTDAHTDNPGVYFMNTETHRAHGAFATTVDIWAYGPGQLRGEIIYHPNVVAPDGSLGVYRYQFQSNEAHPFRVVALSYQLLAASMPLLEDDLAYYPMPGDALALYHKEQELYDNSRVNVVLEEDILPDIDFIPLNPAEGYGFLRAMDLEESPNPRDVVIYEALPNELPRVAGIITTVPQTPLSHVNLRAVQDGVPNAFIRNALDNTDIDGLIGSYVHYAVTKSGYTIRAATGAEVDAHFASSRPGVEQTPQRDLSVTSISALSGVGFEDWKAFGVKAANVAVLGTFGFPEGTVPDGFAVPFYFYDEFMKHNDFYARVETMLADSEFQEDLEVQESELKKLRKAIKKAETPGWMIEALAEMNALFPEGTNRRYRSSTNNEDLPGFSGAGLYDSKTQKPKEDKEDIAKSLKEVYASLWNFRAFTERDFHRIDHLAAAMGVLVHPNYSDELANGVAVSFNPLYSGKDSWYYVNTQLGEDLVTNPDALSVPEEILLDPAGGEHTVLRTSNQKPRGQLLMSDDQRDQLRRHLTVIDEKFKKLYDIGSDEDFAMEIEFKVTSANVLAIKQARPWVFGPAPASDGAATVTLSAAQPQVGRPLTATLTDPDGGVSGVAWSWHSSQDRTTWTVISGAAAASYTPVEADVGRYLRATASYTDEKGSGNSAQGVSDNAALAAAQTNSPPQFPSTETGNRTVSENEAAGQNIGSPVAATDDDNDALTYFLGGTDAGLFDIVDTSGQLQTKAALDYESKSAYTVTVTATDPSGLADEITVTIDIIDVEDPPAAITLSPSGSVEPGNEIAVTMSFNGLEPDSDTATTDYTFRADVKDSENGDADICEDPADGYGLGVDRYMHKVDEDPETRTGTVSAGCPAGHYTIEASILNAANVELATASAGFSVVEPETPLSSDATLSRLELSGMDFGAFDPAATNYAAEVDNGVTETTVTATVNDNGATYLVMLGGVADSDGVIPLAVGSNVITVEVTAENGDTTKTYAVTVTRAAPPLSTDATLSGLTLSGVDIGAFDPSNTGYTASVANGVTQTTVTPTTNDDGATYSIKLSGVADADGTVPLSVGGNVITVEVTAENGDTRKTYTVTVTRAAPASNRPDTPNRPTGQRTGPGAVSLDWNDVPTATSYKVRFWLATEARYVELSPGHAVHGISIAFNGSSARVSGLPTTAHDSSYYFEVRAFNDADGSGWSPNNAIAAPTDVRAAPDTPKPPTGQRTGAGTVTLDWDDVATATGYQVGLWSDPDLVPLPSDDMPAVKVQMNGSSATLSGLPTEWSHYWLKIRAINDGGASGWSDWLTLENQ